MPQLVPEERAGGRKGERERKEKKRKKEEKKERKKKKEEERKKRERKRTYHGTGVHIMVRAYYLMGARPAGGPAGLCIRGGEGLFR